ncbi:type II secretion system protein GspL [Comamonas endophytica]|uniref:Type II secretion system protein GspL n=1 Tax=Comamonas endophytica TaxID=2949090 RepID=A0ABY6GCG9_9BURK|nr:MULTISPECIES: type II secretion system protein GspL [unclassified Acidovorax]MCD2512884.1 type II secretion system protein GspL [Acidovorax sp. D4N7]UYG52769.1 type II secretion system protein GspL [Acidovorax sp. 5MLIR]
MSLLIIQLPLAPAGPEGQYAFALSLDGQAIARHAAALAAELPPAGRAVEVVAAVPPQALSWHRVTLPAGIAVGTRNATARLRSVVEGLVEEHLLDEPEELHFALQPGARAGQEAWVAVCDRAWLRSHLQALEGVDRRVDRIVPQVAPAEEGAAPQLWAVGTPESAWLLATGTGPDQGVACVPLGSEGLALLGVPDDLPVDAAPAVSALAERLQRPVRLAATAERLLEASRGPWDLAQFDLAVGGRSHALRRLANAVQSFARAPQWRAARWALGVLVVAQVAGLNAWAWKERQALAAKQAAVRASLLQAFPKIPLVVDAPAQMEREVAQLRQRTGSLSAQSLEPMLSAAGQALPRGMRPQAIDYLDQELRLRGLNLDAGTQQQLQSKLAAQGYAARVDAQGVVLNAKEQP